MNGGMNEEFSFGQSRVVYKKRVLNTIVVKDFNSVGLVLHSPVHYNNAVLWGGNAAPITLRYPSAFK